MTEVDMLRRELAQYRADLRKFIENLVEADDKERNGCKLSHGARKTALILFNTLD